MLLPASDRRNPTRRALSLARSRDSAPRRRDDACGGGRETPANNAIVLSPLVGRRPALGLGEALSQVVRLRGRRGRSLRWGSGGC